VDSLKRLEYRGTIPQGSPRWKATHLARARAEGKLKNLEGD